jgi:hypothetical protein
MGRLARVASLGGRGAASIADQASSAAIGFLCSVFIGRYLGAEALGLYAITTVCVLLVSASQASIVLEPMSVFVSVREDVESVESPVIPCRGGMQEAADVDAGEPPPL